MTDPFKFTTIAFTGRDFLGPYDATAIRELAGACQGPVVDFGCGKGTVMEALGLSGVGIEENPHCAEEAVQRNPASQIWTRDAKESLQDIPPNPGMVVCLGASQAIGTPGEALAYFATLLPTGGHLLYGDGFWEKPPSQDYLDFLGAKESEMPYLENATYEAKSFGFLPLKTYVSTQADWDSFEDSYFANVIRWCDENPNDPDEEAFRARITKWRDGYLKWGRGTLGFAITLYERE